MSAREISVVVTAQVPSGVSVAEWKAYVELEVACNVGRMHPDEPLFELDRKSVKVSSVPAQKKPRKIVSPKGGRR
jgi:hypothetical protein